MGKNLPFLFIDVETTGHDPLKRVRDITGARALVPWHEIIDLGAVWADPTTFKLLGEFDNKIFPEHPERCIENLINDYPARAARGEWRISISLEHAIDLLLDKTKRICGKGVVIPGGQNFFFDWSFLSVAFAWLGIDEVKWSKYFHYSKFDTRSMAIQKFWESGTPFDPSDYSLRNDKLAKALGIPPEPLPHEAINGARQAYEVFKKLKCAQP